MSDPTFDELRDVAVRVAEEAGALLRQHANGVRSQVETKSSLTDMVTEIDHQSESLVAQLILTERPADGILGEEGMDVAESSGVRWIVDPLDGTTNYLYGFKAYAVSIAAELHGQIVAGAIHDAVHNETFAAALGMGASCNGQRIAVAEQDNLAQALTGTGFAYQSEIRARQAGLLAEVLPNVRDIRRAGSAALDLCSVACGRLDCYYEAGLAPWDRAAGMLIVSEAGGLVEFVDLGDEPGLRQTVVAGGPAVYGALRELLERAAGNMAAAESGQ